jgi:hypothetical protein
MTLIELKKSLHEQIDGVTDEHLLEEVAAILKKKEKGIYYSRIYEGRNKTGRTRY